MAINANKLKNVLQTAFPDGIVKVIDLAGDEEHYEVEIQSKSFVGLSLIAQHRLVYKALESYDIHAIKIKTLE